MLAVKIPRRQNFIRGKMDKMTTGKLKIRGKDRRDFYVLIGGMPKFY